MKSPTLIAIGLCMYVFLLSGVQCDEHDDDDHDDDHDHDHEDSATHDEQFHGPCEDVNCGLEEECFHHRNTTTQKLEAVCIAGQDVPMLIDGSHQKFAKHCPEYDTPKGRMGCGPYNDQCFEDAECDNTKLACCNNGCDKVCVKYYLKRLT